MSAIVVTEYSTKNHTFFTCREHDLAQDAAMQYASKWIDSHSKEGYTIYAVVGYEGLNEWSEHIYNVQCIDLSKVTIH